MKQNNEIMNFYFNIWDTTQQEVCMIHGHYFDFTDEPSLQTGQSENAPVSKHITVKYLPDTSLLEAYTLKRPWVPLSGQEGRYFSRSPFEEADANFSWGLELKDLLTLLWVPEKSFIYYTKSQNYTPERLRFWIYHTFFPLVMELGQHCHVLHVGAVELEEKPVLFSAPSFGGKSTLTDYFIKKGHTLLSDDTLGIEKKGADYCCIPSYPFHRPYREPETLGYPVQNFATKAKVLHGIYILQEASADAPVTITPLHGIEKFKTLNQSSFIDFPFLKKRRFRFFMALAQEVPVFTVSIPWDIERLEEVYQAIIHH